jgi:NADH:ubiquinone oxidoreductase subunit 2 (subunit N)
MTVGVISLAVPGSASFAGEFLILAGVFQRHWWWAAIGAGAIVLAAMYMLRLISAVLHEARGSTVSDAALDLRPGSSRSSCHSSPGCSSSPPGRRPSAATPSSARARPQP